ncbi:MAG: uracil-DNA glycosylase [Pseudomonadota bacterium]
MTEMTSETALKALTEWWDDMGVPADVQVLKAYARAGQTAAAPPARGDTKDAAKPTPARRKSAKSVEAWVEDARAIAAGCTDVESLARAISAFDGCPLKEGCRNTVVFDGQIGARIMVIGEGPGAEEDKTGKPFVGRAGQLLDRMLGAIGLSRADNALITNVNYWRPPRNRNPEAAELAVCRPFVDRMIELTAPTLIIAAGAVPAQSLLATQTGIMRLRGSEKQFATPGGFEAPLFPILHPAFLLRRPQEKSRAWRDLQMIESRARELGALD